MPYSQEPVCLSVVGVVGIGIGIGTDISASEGQTNRTYVCGTVS